MLELLLTAAVGGQWGGQEGVEYSIFPTQYMIDYVRIYKEGPEIVPIISSNVTEEFIQKFKNGTSLQAFLSETPISKDVLIFDVLGNKVEVPSGSIAKIKQGIYFGQYKQAGKIKTVRLIHYD